jgi:iron complex outermembrane recepter protein
MAAPDSTCGNSRSKGREPKPPTRARHPQTPRCAPAFRASAAAITASCMHLSLSACALVRALLLLVGFFLAPWLSAAPDETGALSGRVMNSASGAFLGRARVTIEGTQLEALTDSSGEYRFASVPAGLVRLHVFYTGLPPSTSNVSIAPGQSNVHDVSIAPSGASDVVELDAFVVESKREMAGAAIAINEQRFAPSIKNVVSADEFGFVPDGNVGELTKFLPGIAVNYAGGEGRSISINGVPPNFVPITVGGFNLASANSSGPNRQTELEQLSVNNISRIEVNFSATPDFPASALGGSVNLVPRSAFERSKAFFSANAYLNWRPTNISFSKTPGPLHEPTRKVQPGFDFIYTVPVNKRLGFSLSANTVNTYSPQDYAEQDWRGANAGTGGTVTINGVTQVAYPATTPEAPYLRAFTVRDGAKQTQRTSFGATIDYKLSEVDQLTFALQYAFFDAQFMNHVLNFVTNAVSSFGPGYTQGTGSQGFLDTGNSSGRDKYGTTIMPTLTWRHYGAVWRMESGFGYSRASNHYRDSEQGYFTSVRMRRTGVTLRFDETGGLRPQRISVIEPTTGASVDPFDIGSYTITDASVNPLDGVDVQRKAYGFIARDFDWLFPLTLKTGFDINDQTRDLTGGSWSYNFVGPGGAVVSTPIAPGGAQNGAAQILDESFSQRQMPFGFPKMEWPSHKEAWDLLLAQPTWWALNGGENSKYRSLASTSRKVQETVSSAYVRGDASFFNRRLKIVGGVRAENTRDRGEGPLTDITLNYQRDASGNIVRNANGTPALIETDPLLISKRTLLERKAIAKKEYFRVFPSINASYNIRDDLVFRAAYYTSIGRPNFNQYAGGVTLPDLDRTPSASNRISVNNVGVKAWEAESYMARLEYYFKGVGVLSVGGFRRSIKNFFGSQVFAATPEFLEHYGLDEATYGIYEVSTQSNISEEVEMTGWDINYKQSLTFLPHWARGIQVFGNISKVDLDAPDVAYPNLMGFVPTSINWGLSLSRDRYNVRLSWNYRGRQRNARVTGTSLDPDTWNYTAPRLYVDLNAEYMFARHWRVFLAVRNLGHTTEDIEIYGPTTADYARLRSREDYHPLWTTGVKATY